MHTTDKVFTWEPDVKAEYPIEMGLGRNCAVSKIQIEMEQKDTINRQWSGLIRNFYKPRWERWIEARKKELKGEKFEQNTDWFEWEWKWNCEY